MRRECSILTIPLVAWIAASYGVRIVGAQSQALEKGPLAFEVASVKPNEPPTSVSGGCHGAPASPLNAALVIPVGANLDLNSITGRGISMAQLAAALSGLPGDVPVVDNTGLTGLYDVSLSWEPDEELSRVVQDQLGLRFERGNVLAEFIIIDTAERPTEN